MRLSVYALPSLVPAQITGPAVVIDVLRATSVIVTALANGASSVTAVAEIETAFSLKQASPAGRVLVGGERNALIVPGFDFGNSPREYRADAVRGKQIVLTTSNGTQALAALARVQPLLIGAFLNARAVAQELADLGRDAALVCAGTLGRFTLDDTVCAGQIAWHLSNLVPALELDDLAFSARFLYQHHRQNIKELIRHAWHYSFLQNLGLEKDIDYCLQTDVLDMVPRAAGGVITF